MRSSYLVTLQYLPNPARQAGLNDTVAEVLKAASRLPLQIWQKDIPHAWLAVFWYWNSYKEKNSCGGLGHWNPAIASLLFEFNGSGGGGSRQGLDPHLDIFLLKRERKKCHRGFCRRRRRLVRVTIALWSERFLHGISNLPMRIEEKHPHLELAAPRRRRCTASISTW